MPDMRPLAEAGGFDEPVLRLREVDEPERTGRLRRSAETGQVDRVDRRARRQRRDRVPPRFGESPEAVQQNDGRPAAFDDVVQTETIDSATAELQVRHGSPILPEELAELAPEREHAEDAAGVDEADAPAEAF